MRWAQAWSRSVLVVAVGRGSPPVFDGVESGGRSTGYATLCVPPGVASVAFVTWGSTGRSWGGGVASSPELYGARMTLTRLGVGVNGGCFLVFVACPVVAGTLLAFLTGVTGTLNSGASPSPLMVTSSFFSARDFAFFAVALGVRELAERFFTLLVVTGLAVDDVGRLVLESLLDRRTDMVVKERTSIQESPIATLRPKGTGMNLQDIPTGPTHIEPAL